MCLALMAAVLCYGPPPMRSQAASSPKPLTLTFVTIPQHGVRKVGGIGLTETFDPATYERRDYIQSPLNSPPREFYLHHRGIAVAVVPACHVLIVEDDYTTKLSKLVAVNLPSLAPTGVSEDAVSQYRIDVGAGPDIFVNAQAFAISRDCAQALVSVALTSASAATPEEAAAAATRYPTRWYVVSLSTGKMTHSFPLGPRPANWQ